MASDGPILDFRRTLDALDQSRPFGKGVHQTRLLAQVSRVLGEPGGVVALFADAGRFDAAGVFLGSDWDTAQNLQPSLVRRALLGGGTTAALEALSQLRFLAIATGAASHDEVTADDARTFLDDVIARNIDLLFPEANEVTREAGAAFDRAHQLFAFIADHLGTAGIVGALVTECERVLTQRPVMANRVDTMLAATARALEQGAVRADDDSTVDRAQRLVDAWQAPTDLARANAEPGAFASALHGLDDEALAAEAAAFGDRMEATGLVSPVHADLVRHVAAEAPTLLATALALDPVGGISLASHLDLITRVIDRAVHPDTARSIYGLSRLLNRGILFFRPVPPGLERLLLVDVAPTAAERLESGHVGSVDVGGRLLAGALSVIGQPRGVDQGNNPTCQAARAISLWSQNDVGYLLELIASAARDDRIVTHFEGDAIDSSDLQFGLAKELDTDLDAVSLLLTPHLDRIYMEMSRRTIGRGDDGHRWVNPEFHGWWVHRGFSSVVEVGTGSIVDFDGFIRRFHATYHPAHNGGRATVYAQPCGVVSTDPNGEFVGWHAVSIQRVALDPVGAWRVYFFNPNRDKGQVWGPGMETSTHGNGELEGESSLPFEQFAARLYVLHHPTTEIGDPALVPAEAVERIRVTVADSWGRDRTWA